MTEPTQRPRWTGLKRPHWAVLAAAAVVLVAAIGGGVAAWRSAHRSPLVAAWGWGENQFGQLGPTLSATTGETRPVLVPARTTQLVAGGDFVLAVADHHVYAWGHDARGELGDGTHRDRMTPRRVDLPDVASVAADAHHALAVTTGGEVYAWGGNDSGEIGDGTTRDRLRPVRVHVDGDVRSVATGTASSFAVTDAGQLWAWGASGGGRLGLGSVRDSARPHPVRLPEGVKVRQVAAGPAHAVALTDRGTLLMWGTGTRGQLGQGTRTVLDHPTTLRLPGSAHVVQVAAGLAHTAVVREDGSVWAWGADDRGQLDGRPGPDRSRPAQVRLPGAAQVREISVSSDRTVALARDGRVLTWGASSFALRTAGNSAGAVRTVALGSRSRPLLAAVGDDFAVVVVRADAPQRILSPRPAYVAPARRRVNLVATVVDRDGNVLDQRVTASVPGGRCRGLVCSVASSGTHRVTLRAGDLRAHVDLVTAR